MTSELAEQQEVVRGVVDRVTFRNAQNGYSVIQVALDNSRDRLTVVGICPHARVGSYVKITGS